MRYLFARLVAFAAAWLSPVSAAREYTLHDMLALEGYGRVLVTPDGRTAVVDRRSRYDAAQRFEYGYQVRRLTSRVMLTSLERPGRLEPAFPQLLPGGYWSGAFGPRAPLLTVFRLHDGVLSLGVADVARRSVRWLPGAPDLPIASPAPVWLDDRRIAFIRFERPRLPFVLDSGGRVQRELPRRWIAAREGRRPSADVASTSAAWTQPLEDGRQLVEVDVVTGRSRVLMAGALVDFVVAPDGRHVAALSEGEPISPDAGVAVTANTRPRRLRVALLDMKSGHVTAPCGRCDARPLPFVFSTDGDLLLRARFDGETWASARLRVLRSAKGAGAARGIPHPAALGDTSSGPAAWLGEGLLLRGEGGGWRLANRSRSVRLRVPPDAQLISAGRSLATLSSGSQLWRVDGRGRVSRATDRLRRAGLDHLDPAGMGVRRLSEAPPLTALRLGDGALDVVASTQAPSRAETRIPSGAQLLAVSSYAGAALALVTDEQGVGTLQVHGRDGQAHVVDAISRHLADVALPEAKLIERRARDGRRLFDWLFLPQGRLRPPLVVVPYQGTTWSHERPSSASPAYFGAATNVMLLVARGYAVLLPSLPVGSEGSRRASLLRDVDAALDAAVATGRVDGDRVALHGHSYGGVNAISLAVGSRRYRGVVAASGASDLGAGYGTVPPAQRLTLGSGIPLDGAVAWYETGQGGLGVPPWSDPERYLRSSPFYEADRIAVPLLLIGGDLDYVPMEQAERLYVSLARLGRDATLVRYYGEGHVLQSPANIRHQWSKILDFLSRTMGPSDRGDAVGSGPVTQPRLETGIDGERPIVGVQAERVRPESRLHRVAVDQAGAGEHAVEEQLPKPLQVLVDRSGVVVGGLALAPSPQDERRKPIAHGSPHQPAVQRTLGEHVRGTCYDEL
jgi:hypothetical protein